MLTNWSHHKFHLTYLGRCTSVTIDKDNTTIVGGKGTKEDITARINQIKAQIENTTSDYDKEKLQERLAKLSGGVAVLNVGAATEVEMKEKCDGQTRRDLCVPNAVDACRFHPMDSKS